MNQSTTAAVASKTRASVITALVLSSVFTLDLVVNLWAVLPLGALLSFVWPILTLIGGPIGTYQGSQAMRWSTAVTVMVTVLSILPPVGLVIQIVLLAKWPKVQNDQPS
jgi:uncharacterized membrane protein